MKYNAGIPSTAAVEGLFSLKKNVLNPKQSGLSNFNVLMDIFCAVFATATTFVGVIYWYASMFSDDLREKILLSLYIELFCVRFELAITTFSALAVNCRWLLKMTSTSVNRF